LLLSSPPLQAFWLFLHFSLSCSFIFSANFLLIYNISLFNFSFIIFNTASEILSVSGSFHHLFFSPCNSLVLFLLLWLPHLPFSFFLSFSQKYPIF
jgi:hypothetical protein